MKRLIAIAISIFFIMSIENVTLAASAKDTTPKKPKASKSVPDEDDGPQAKSAGKGADKAKSKGDAGKGKSKTEKSGFRY